MSDFDFGFTMVDEEELDIVQQFKSATEDEGRRVGSLETRLNLMYNMIMPLLNNLAANPEKDYIKWDGKDRLAKIEQFRDKLDEVYNGLS